MAEDRHDRPRFPLLITLALVVLVGLYAGAIAIAGLITGRVEMPTRDGVSVIYYARTPGLFIAAVAFCLFIVAAAVVAVVNFIRQRR